MGNSQTSLSVSSSKKDFSLPSEILLNLFDITDIQDTEQQPYKTIYLVSPIFDGKKHEIRKAERKITLVIVGDGDYQLNINSIDYLVALKESGIKIDTLILNDLEVEPKVLREILEILKDDLLSLRFNRVLFDQGHVEILNEIKLHLKHLSIAYVLPDNKNIFDENNNAKNTSIDLNLINLGQEIRYLDLKGIPISQNIQEGIRQFNALEHLFLEHLVGNNSQNLHFIKSILAEMHRFPKLTSLSLAGNNLSSINFAELQENSKSVFPPTLKKLNLNSTNLNDKRLQELNQLLKSSEIKLNALSLSKCYGCPQTLKDLKKYTKSTGNPDFQYQTPIKSIDKLEEKNILDDLTENNNPEKKLAVITTQEQQFRIEMLKSFIEFFKNLITFIEESRKQENPTGLASIAKLTTASQYLPIILKDAAAIKAFLNACQYNFIDFSRDPKSLIPKNDFSLALKYPKVDLDKTVGAGDEESIGEYIIPFINQVHLDRVSDEIFAGRSMETQRELFLSLMEQLGYRSTEVEHDDGIEDVFKVMVDNSQCIGWDTRLAIFSIIWRPQYHTVSVKFNLSDDCFMERKDRTNYYKLSNQDYLIDLLSTLNLKPLDFSGELDVLADGETEVNIRYNIIHYGVLNLAKLLLVAIDKGFIFLRVLQEKNIFDREDSSAVEEDARQIRKTVKNELKAYAQLEEFLKFSKSDNQ